MGRIQIYITNLGRYNEGYLVGEWVKLPINKSDLCRVLDRIGINEQYEEYFISDFESFFDNLHISEYASISDLNDLAGKIDSLADCDIDKLAAVLESEGCTDISTIKEIIENLDSFDLLEDVDDDEALGVYYAECGCIFHNVPENIQRYFDFESYGRDIRLELSCCYTSYGLVIDNR